MVCRDFILPEPASYVFFYAIFNLRKLLYIIDFSFNDGQDYLYFQSSFGQLNLFSTTGNNLMLCTTSRQKEFLQQVYDMLSSDTP